MKSLRIVSLLLLVVFSLSMISGVSASQTPSLKNKQLNVHINQKIVIKLESNPSTGYTWLPVFNKKYLKGISNGVIPNKNPWIIGAPEVQKIVFNPIKNGETTIVMKYVRSWDKKHPIKEIIYHVKITK